MLMLLVSTASEVLCPADIIERGNASSRSLSALPNAATRRRRQGPADGLAADARIDAAAAVKAALRICVVEVVQDAGHLHALVLVELMFELRVHAEPWLNIRYLPTMPLEFAKPCGKRALVELSSRRDVSAPLADTTTARAF